MTKFVDSRSQQQVDELTDDQRERARLAVREMMGDRACQICECPDLVIDGRLGALMKYDPSHKHLALYGRMTLAPYVEATCPKCGHTLFFNAIVLGLVDDEEGDALA